MPISPELLAKIDALPYADLNADILDTLNDPSLGRAQAYAQRTGTHCATNESIFENMVRTYLKVKAQRETREILMYRWRDDEVLAFIEHFKKTMPQSYAEFLRQEREDHEIDGDLWFRDLPNLAEQWHPGLLDDDYSDLFVKVRLYVQAHLI